MAVGLKKMGKPSPLKLPPMAWMGIAQVGASLLGGLIGSKRRRREQREAREAMEKSRAAYMQQEYVNPYADMENVYEDLTVNQQQAQFQAQQGAQQRANILEGLRGTAGGAGIAGLAQAMARQSTLQTQQISASIGQQEAMNQRLRAQGAAKVQQLEAYGEQAVSLREQQRMETLYGMDMSRVTAANRARQQSRQQMIAGIGAGLGTIAGGMGGGTTAKMGGTTPGGTGFNIDPSVGYDWGADPQGFGNQFGPYTTGQPSTGTGINIGNNEYDIWGNPIQQIPSPFNKRKSKKINYGK